MDGLNLFAPNDAGLRRLIDLVETSSSNIRLSFGAQKCAKLTVKRGKPVSTGLTVTINDEICDLSYRETYRFSRGWWG